MGKIEIGVQLLRNLLMASKLLTVVGREGVHKCFIGFQVACDCFLDRLSRASFHLVDPGQAGLALGEGHNSLLVPFADDGILFPISQTLALFHNGRSLLDTYPVSDSSTAIIAAVTLATLLLAA